MEQKNLVSDEKLLEIAKMAIQKHFSESELDGIELVLKKNEPNFAEITPELTEPPVVSVWIVHQNGFHPPNRQATTAANKEMWSKLQEHNDNRIFLLYNRYPNDPAPRKTAA
jgi:hypothetical protein